MTLRMRPTNRQSHLIFYFTEIINPADSLSSSNIVMMSSDSDLFGQGPVICERFPNSSSSDSLSKEPDDENTTANPNPTSVKQNSGNKPMRLRGRAKSMRLGSFVQVPDGNMSLSDEMAWLRRHRNSQGRLSLQEKRENMKTEGVAIFTLPLSPSGSVDSSSRILHLLPHELSYRNVEAVEEVFFGIDPDNADQYNQDGTIRDTIDANRIVAEDYDPMELGPGLISICPISSKYPREAQWNHANQNGEDGNESPKLARLPKVVLELQRRLVQSIEASMKLDLMGPPCQEFFIM
eukprot:GHVH01007357.1.p1 GENE.GHVH01007357.1~~GHVH01007357.1.p1  ORF type:complete len:293 (+),score=37.84 GHVH01007357.1:566-1444(+)